MGLGRGQQAPLQQDFLGHGGTGKPQQAGQFTGVHGKAQLHDRCAEARRFAGDAQVAGAGDLQPAADAGPRMAATVGCGQDSIAASASPTASW
jgi:hypothetical protein